MCADLKLFKFYIIFVIFVLVIYQTNLQDKLELSIFLKGMSQIFHLVGSGIWTNDFSVTEPTSWTTRLP
jgi:hypothetical protein